MNSFSLTTKNTEDTEITVKKSWLHYQKAKKPYQILGLNAVAEVMYKEF